MRHVLFVCEHGAAKSVVAAALFNRMAAERGLTVRAVSRGTDLDPCVNPVARAGLAAEGLAWDDAPTLLAPGDLTAAARVIAFSSLPALAGAPVEIWSAPAVGDGYAAARTAIAVHVARLVDEMVREVPTLARQPVDASNPPNRRSRPW